MKLKTNKQRYTVGWESLKKLNLAVTSGFKLSYFQTGVGAPSILSSSHKKHKNKEISTRNTAEFPIKLLSYSHNIAQLKLSETEWRSRRSARIKSWFYNRSLIWIKRLCRELNSTHMHHDLQINPFPSSPVLFNGQTQTNHIRVHLVRFVRGN